MKKYFLLFILSVVIYFAHSAVTSQGLYGDGNGYYVYTQSLFFDHTLNSPKIYAYLTNFVGPKYIFSRIFWDPKINPYSIGTSILWLPGMAIASFFAANRFDIMYELFCGLTGILFMIGGLYFLENYLLNFFGKRSVFWTLLVTFFATSVFYYTAFEPALSHQPSFFVICFLLWWTHGLKTTPKNVLILGLLTGILAMVRAVDALLLIPVYYQVKLKAKDLWLLFAGCLIAYIPQLVNQYIVWGGIFTNPYLTGANGKWELNLSHLYAYLFSPKRGLFLWSPVLLIGFWGLIKSRSKTFALTIILFSITASSWSAYTSAGFGQRMAFSTIPYLAYGLAVIFQNVKLKTSISIFLIFSLWNTLLLKNVYLHKNIFIQKDNFKITEFIKYMVLLR